MLFMISLDGNGYRSTDGTSDATFYLIMTVSAILIIVIPGTAVVCIRRSKQRYMYILKVSILDKGVSL